MKNYKIFSKKLKVKSFFFFKGFVEQLKYKIFKISLIYNIYKKILLNSYLQLLIFIFKNIL